MAVSAKLDWQWNLPGWKQTGQARVEQVWESDSQAQCLLQPQLDLQTCESCHAGQKMVCFLPNPKDMYFHICVAAHPSLCPRT